jgi:hypothetical protein
MTIKKPQIIVLLVVVVLVAVSWVVYQSVSKDELNSSPAGDLGVSSIGAKDQMSEYSTAGKVKAKGEQVIILTVSISVGTDSAGVSKAEQVDRTVVVVPDTKIVKTRVSQSGVKYEEKSLNDIKVGSEIVVHSNRDMVKNQDVIATMIEIK